MRTRSLGLVAVGLVLTWTSLPVYWVTAVLTLTGFILLLVAVAPLRDEARAFSAAFWLLLSWLPVYFIAGLLAEIWPGLSWLALLLRVGVSAAFLVAFTMGTHTVAPSPTAVLVPLRMAAGAWIAGHTALLVVLVMGRFTGGPSMVILGVVGFSMALLSAAGLVFAARRMREDEVHSVPRDASPD